MELNENRVDELDIEAAVNFALYAIGDASRFWLEAAFEQKQRFQQALFPDGLRYNGKEFETATTCLASSYLQEISRTDSRLASRRESNPCRRREREATYCNLTELNGMDNTVR